MITFDLHYHPNVCRVSPSVRQRRLLKHASHIRTVGVDYLACTEHAYKNPLDGYRFLRDALGPYSNTTLIPGVECISREGVDIIFLFRRESDLEDYVRHVRPFSWTVTDMEKMARDFNAITVVPHPFSPGKTGLAKVMGLETYYQVTEKAHYVEVHNSASHLMKRFARKKFAKQFDTIQKQIAWTMDLPHEYRMDGVGWAVGSDVHFPGQQFYIGAADVAMQPGEDWFDLLKGRIKFEPVETEALDMSLGMEYRCLIKNSRCVLSESTIKAHKRAKRWIRRSLSDFAAKQAA
ncbi:MAG: hypothetical protein HQL54_10810 [Magnetococcales bacterium]|nr:hypothetical protein [Magnetococcales bacterium]